MLKLLKYLFFLRPVLFVHQLLDPVSNLFDYLPPVTVSLTMKTISQASDDISNSH